MQINLISNAKTSLKTLQINILYEYVCKKISKKYMKLTQQHTKRLHTMRNGTYARNTTLVQYIKIKERDV